MNEHESHPHVHGPGCGHSGVRHGDHVDYLHDGHLHHMQGGNTQEHHLEADRKNATRCTPSHKCAGHDESHDHAPGCGHEAVPHGDHTDYLVGGHLHHAHGTHCDNHGPVQIA
jgi:hypothetical protein